MAVMIKSVWSSTGSATTVSLFSTNPFPVIFLLVPIVTHRFLKTVNSVWIDNLLVIMGGFITLNPDWSQRESNASG